jgi:hypothetical protein
MIKWQAVSKKELKSSSSTNFNKNLGQLLENQLYSLRNQLPALTNVKIKQILLPDGTIHIELVDTIQKSSYSFDNKKNQPRQGKPYDGFILQKEQNTKIKEIEKLKKELTPFIKQCLKIAIHM